MGLPKALLSEIIAELNDLFTGDFTDDDKLTYVRAVIRGKLLESTTLQQQASANSKEPFGASPDLGTALMDAIISALDAHQAMRSQPLSNVPSRPCANCAMPLPTPRRRHRSMILPIARDCRRSTRTAAPTSSGES